MPDGWWEGFVWWRGKLIGAQSDKIKHILFASKIGVSAMIVIWTVRLGSHLLFRAMKCGGDSRFAEATEKPSLFFVYWTLQVMKWSLLNIPLEKQLVTSKQIFSCSHKSMHVRFYVPLCSITICLTPQWTVTLARLSGSGYAVCPLLLSMDLAATLVCSQQILSVRYICVAWVCTTQ